MVKKRVEAESPDPFVQAASQALGWASRHRLLIATVVVLCLAGAAAVWGWFSHKGAYNRESGLAFSQALRVYHGIDPSTHEGIDAAVKAFREVVRRYPNSLWASLAHLYLGRCYELEGEHAKAEGELATGVQGIKNKEFFFPQWLVALTGIQDPQKGIEDLKACLKQENPFLEPYLRYNLALLYQERGDIKDAVKTLEDLRGRFPSSPFAQEAARLLEVLK